MPLIPSKPAAVLAALVAFSVPGPASAQECDGQRLDTIRDRCNAKFVEVETPDEQFPIYEEESGICFRPGRDDDWRWFCRGFEQFTSCRTRGRVVGVEVEIRRGEVIWTCYGDR